MPNENNQNPAVDSPVATPAATSAASAAAAATEAAEAATSAAMDEVDNPAAPMAPAAPTIAAWWPICAASGEWDASSFLPRKLPNPPSTAG